MGSDDKTLAERAAEGARKLDEAARVQNTEQDARLAKDRERDALWLARACTPPSRGWLGFLGRKHADVDGERAWLGALPFRVDYYESIFSDSIAFERWVIRLEFVDKAPEEPLLVGLFGNLPGKISIGTTRVGPARRRDFYAQRDLSDEERRAANRAWHVRLQFHEAVDQVLLPLHKEFPLVAIECRDSHHFDMGR